MYFPKSQIQTGFFSNGELLIANSNTLYTGPYFITSDNQKYSGKEPNNGKNTLLIFPSENPSLPITQNPNNPVDDPRFNPLNLPYSTAIKASRSNIPYSPVSYYPILSQEDTQNGEFTRYFAKKSNENIYTEISSTNFGFSSNSKLYLTFQLPWVINGEKEKVKQINTNQIQLTERTLRINGLNQFLKYNYLQFYQG
jgi:hypothetical protein